MADGQNPQGDFQYIKLPDGSYGKFAANADDATIHAAISKDFPDAYKEQPGMGQRLMSGAGDLLTGAAKGALHTISGTDEWAREHLPGFLTNSNMGFGKPADLEHVKEMATPTNTTQKIGYGGEQIGEFLIPGSAEEKGAAKLAELAPKLGKFAKPAAKVAMSALSSGAVNKAQGGGFAEGAATGAVGRAGGEALHMAAPTLTGIAQGLKAPFAKTGTAILEDTSGILPGSIRKSAKAMVGELTPQLEAAADNSTARVPMLPARMAAADEFGKASAQNATKLRKGIGRMANQLIEREHVPAPGAAGPSAVLPIPDDVSAREYLDLKRGIGKALPSGSWSPESANAFKGPRNAIYGTMADEFHNAVPEATPLDKRISALIPATEKPKNFFFGHALGPGVGATLGGVGGWRRDGIPGAITGAVEGGVAGMAFPTAMNLMARGAFNPTMQRVIAPTLTGGALQMTRKKE